MAAASSASRCISAQFIGRKPAERRQPRADHLRRVIRLEATGTVVGLLPSAAYGECTLQLYAGDVLLAFTDGISEAMTMEDEEWGEDRLILHAEEAIASGSPSAEEMLLDVLSGADKFAAGAEQHDDMTLLVLRLK